MAGWDGDYMKKKLILLVIAGVVLAISFLKVTSVSATFQEDSCGTYTYEFGDNGNNNGRVVTHFDNSFQLDVSGINGWSVIDVDLDEEGQGTNWVDVSDGPLNNFNPGNLGNIDKVRVTVYKACPTASPSPTVSPTPTSTPEVTSTPSPTPTVKPCDGECEPTATPSATPKPTPVSCGQDEHIDASGQKCVKFSQPESPEFFRNQGGGTPYPGLPGEGQVRGVQK